MNLPLLFHSGDRASFTYTSAVATLATVLLKTLLAGVTVGSVAFGPGPDAGIIAALLTPTLGAYVMRRAQESKDAAGGTP